MRNAIKDEYSNYDELFVYNIKMSTIKLSVIFFLLEFTNLSLQHEQIPKAKTVLGSVSGYYKESRSGKTYEAYEGIPYAEIPVGELRFEVRTTIMFM